MVITKPEWFKSKKGDFWRLDIPWQGHVYMLLMFLLPFTLFLILPNDIKPINFIVFLFMVINFLIAYQKSFDERDKKIYTIAGSNAFWGIMLSFFVSVPLLVIYNPILSMYNPNPNMAILFIVTILVGVLTFVGTLALQYKKED